MLFNSAEFLFLYLPVVALGFYVLSARAGYFGIIWLALASLYFYADWKAEYLWIILASILGNFFIGRILDPIASPPRTRRLVLALGISINLGVLGYYKYTGFLLTNLSQLGLVDLEIPTITLPLAISFFTFQQIAYLIDSYRGHCREYSFASYCLFVTFFPQLIAGPIVHHSEMLPQFEVGGVGRADARRFAIGLTILSIGLFKKVVIADGVAPLSTSVFAVADSGGNLSTAQAWLGATAYTVQLYFDFSGYSDMAVGAARLFGIVLPINFFSPYKSRNIIEFWRRWHMTLSRFLRDYVYISLGGNRKGRPRRYANLFITMLLGGIWHGAGWNFLIWGGLHGTFLMINHGWRALVRKSPFLQSGQTAILGTASWLVTFLGIMIGWVFFRAETFNGALQMLSRMFHYEAIASPSIPAPGVTDLMLLAGGLAGSLLLPNSCEFLRNQTPVLGMPRESSGVSIVKAEWRPTPGWAFAVGIIFCLSLLHLGRVSEFLYFQF